MDFSQQIRTDVVAFADKILGVPLHPDQVRWIKNANKKINILRPGNRWGKSFVEAVIHVWQCMCKPQIAGRVTTPEQWLQIEYQTLNFGPGYEQAREILRLARDIVQGNVLIPPQYQDKYGYTNKSQLKDWAIIEDKSEAQMLPQLVFKTGSKLLGRSYSEMGQAFKMKRLAFISGDECADVAELWTFTNGTLLPRLVDMGGIIHFVGTPQAEGIDYMQMIEMAEEDMAKSDYKERGQFYTQRGTMYDNLFLPREEIERTERIADETLRKQIIYGEYVETGDKYFGSERVFHSIDKDLELLHEGGGRKYLTTVDFAGGTSEWADYTAALVIDYTEEPYRVVHFWRIKGGDMPIPLQYSQVEDILHRFPGKLIIDASALGGKNALAFLRHLNPIPVEISARLKGEMLSTLKVAFDGGQSKHRRREVIYDSDGNKSDLNPDWGLIRFPNIPVLVNELQNYKLDDTKLRTDSVMALAQGVHWLEMRRPKLVRKGEVAFDLAAL